MFTKLKIRVKFFLNDLRFLKILFSPFRPFGLNFYAGRIAIGTPYFYPRRAVKDKDNPGWLKFVPRKVGFDFVSLGWKTKWSDTDFRFEWGPLLSFVFFGYQIVVRTKVNDPDQYWEAWLYYEYATDKTKSRRERIAQCRKEFPQTWTTHHGDDTKVTVDHYNLILKPKYLK
jgi:hypothetical protein